MTIKIIAIDMAQRGVETTDLAYLIIRTSAIRLKYEDHCRFLCKTCELVQAVRATKR
jgi:hypothetical protein